MIAPFLIYGIAIPVLVTGALFGIARLSELRDGVRSVAAGGGGLAALIGAFGLPTIPPGEFAHWLILISFVICVGALVMTIIDIGQQRHDRYLVSAALLLPFPTLAWQMTTNGIPWTTRFTETGLWLTISACFLVGTLSWTMSPTRETRRTAGWTLSVAFAATGAALILTNSARLGQVLIGCAVCTLLTKLLAQDDEAEQRLLAMGLTLLVGLVSYAQAFVEFPSTAAAAVLVIPLLAIGAREDDERRHQVAAIILSLCLAGASVGITLEAHDTPPTPDEYSDYE